MKHKSLIHQITAEPQNNELTILKSGMEEHINHYSNKYSWDPPH